VLVGDTVMSSWRILLTNSASSHEQLGLMPMSCVLHDADKYKFESLYCRHALERVIRIDIDLLYYYYCMTVDRRPIS
jgi:hypothetical protein